MAVRVTDVLLRVGGVTLQRLQTLASAGAGRVEVAHTFTRADAATCATFFDRDGFIRRAAANVPRIEWVDLDGDGIRETPGIVLEGSRANIIPWSDNLSNWANNFGTPIITTAFVVLGDLDLSAVEDNDAGVLEGCGQNITFTGDAVKGIAFAIRAAPTPSDGNLNRVKLRDVTAGADRLSVDFTWNSDGTLNTAVATVGTLIKTAKVHSSSFPVYRVDCQTTSVTAANTNQVQVLPAGETASNVGKMVVGGFEIENAPFAGSFIKTTGSSVTRAADSFTVPFNFGPMDLTVLARMARPVWADVAGTISANRLRVVDVGALGGNHLELFGQNTAREWWSRFSDGVSFSQSAALTILAGASQAITGQFKTMTTNPLNAIDVGGGLSAFTDGAVAGFTVFGSQTVRIGGDGGGELYGVLLDLIIARGLFTRAEMLAIN